MYSFDFNVTLNPSFKHDVKIITAATAFLTMLIKNLFRYWTYQVFSPGTVLREKYESFKILLEYDKAAHEFMAMLEDIYYTRKKCEFQVIVKTYENFSRSVSGMVEELLKMCPSNYWEKGIFLIAPQSRASPAHSRRICDHYQCLSFFYGNQ